MTGSHREHPARQGLPGQSLRARRRPRTDGTCEEVSVSIAHAAFEPQATQLVVPPPSPRSSDRMEICTTARFSKVILDMNPISSDSL